MVSSSVGITTRRRLVATGVGRRVRAEVSLELVLDMPLVVVRPMDTLARDGLFELRFILILVTRRSSSLSSLEAGLGCPSKTSIEGLLLLDMILIDGRRQLSNREY